MKKKLNKKSTRKYDSERETRVLLEQLGSDVKIIAEGHGFINQKLDKIDGRLNGHDRYFDKLGSRLSSVESELSFVKTAVLDNNQQIKQNFTKMDNLETRLNKFDTKGDRIENKLDTVIVNHENRIQKLESFHH